MKYTIADTKTGRLGCQFSAPEQEAFRFSDRFGCEFVEGAWDSRTHWLPPMADQVELRPIMAGITQAESVLSGLPIPCEVEIRDPAGAMVWSGLVDDGELEVSGDVPGMYRVTCRAFPYLDAVFDIEVAR